ncbi:DsbA family protein [Lujinxingia litoralis]|nr:thioredoxin domain-containing protein [Lujinxingia litoralis]
MKRAMGWWAALAAALVVSGGCAGGSVQDEVVAEAPTHVLVDSELLPVGESPTRGAADAWVTLVVFGDFQCPFCGRLAATLDRVLEDQPRGRVRLVYKHLPLPSHPNAEFLARASEAAANQGKFWQMHDALYDRAAELREGDPSSEVRAIATELGLDVERFERDLDSPEVAARLARDLALADQLGVASVPVVFANGGLIRGAQAAEVYHRASYDLWAATSGAVEDGEMKREEVYAHSVRALLPRSQAARQPSPSAKAVAYVPAHQPRRPESGPAGDALVTITHFHSLGSAPSAELLKRLATLAQVHEGRVRVVTYHLPHQEEEVLAYAHRAWAAAAARAPEVGWEFGLALAEKVAALEVGGAQGAAVVEEIGATLGVDPETINSETSRAQVERDQRLAAELHVVGTPTIFINGTRLVGLPPADELERQVAASEAIAERVAQVRNIGGEELYEVMVEAARQQQELGP